MATVAYIALGSNLGDREKHIREAIARLQRASRVFAVSDLIETAPVGDILQGPFINAAAGISTVLPPRELLRELMAIEREGGRDRSATQRWGPRTVDLDLLLYGDAIIDEPGLSVPHPRMHERMFVLAPLAQIAGEVVHPLFGRAIRQLLNDVHATDANCSAARRARYDEPSPSR